MNGILGLIDLQTGVIDDTRLSTMCRAMSYWNPVPLRMNSQVVNSSNNSNDSTIAQRLPNGAWLVAAARIDNRNQLATKLSLSIAELNQLDDSSLIGRAYLRWGEECVTHIYGDWSFAVWNPAERRLFLARDHFGNTSLYYCRIGSIFAFASSRKALLALDESALHEIDDLYIAQVLLSWPVYHGERTVYPAIKRLPPAHTLIATASGQRTKYYWDLEATPLRPFKSIEEAAEGFLPLFDDAVRARMRTQGSVATTLSGGLDSGSVTATAMKFSNADNKPLLGYTSVPSGPTAEDTERRFGDEWEFASATARHIRLSTHRPIIADSMTPLQGLRWQLSVYDEPQHAASNAYWMVDLRRIARADGCTALLTGQGGNGGISWTGPVANKQKRAGGFRDALRHTVVESLPDSWSLRLHVEWLRRTAPWRKSLAIHPDLMQRANVFDASIGDPQHPMHLAHLDSRATRLAILKPGRSIGGCLHAEGAAAQGIDVRDPTLDVRVLEYCLSVPEHLLIDAVLGTDRMLIRTAMKDRLPDAVRLNRKRGLQAADLCSRLRNDRDAMEACLDELANGRARDYIDMQRLRRAWRNVLEQDDRVALREANVVLLRAVMAGLFVNSHVSTSQSVAVAA